jgi:hypothetical protein
VSSNDKNSSNDKKRYKKIVLKAGGVLILRMLPSCEPQRILLLLLINTKP